MKPQPCVVLVREVRLVAYGRVRLVLSVRDPSQRAGGPFAGHLVPMSAALREVIASVPRIKNGPFLFSLKAGKAPIAMTGPIKADLDMRMLRTLRAMARRRGEDHQAVDLPGWVNHDLRRVVRSGLSALRIPHNVAEAILAHRPPGIVGTYNLHEYEDEKAEALEAWAQRLNPIVSPPAKVPDKKIVPLRKRMMAGKVAARGRDLSNVTYSCEAFVRMLRARKTPNGSSRRASLR